MDIKIEKDQQWWHKRDGRTVRIDAADETFNGYVTTVNVLTGRTSQLRKSTLRREYRLMPDQNEKGPGGEAGAESA